MESGPCISTGVDLDGRAAGLGGLEAGDGCRTLDGSYRQARSGESDWVGLE